MSCCSQDNSGSSNARSTDSGTVRPGSRETPLRISVNPEGNNVCFEVQLSPM